MTADLHARAKSVFSQAVELPAREREAFVGRACGDDAELRHEVTSLLKHHQPDTLHLGGSLLWSLLREYTAGSPPHRPQSGPREAIPSRVDVAYPSFPFGEETVQLLRRRLRALTSVWAVIPLWSLVDSLWHPTWPFVAFRVGVLAAILALVALLHSPWASKLAALRSLELAGLGVIGLQFIVSRSSALCQYALLGDAPATAIAAFWNYAAWSLFILAYGNFIPNSWDRAARVLLPAALIPSLVMWAARRWCSPLGPLLNVPSLDLVWVLPPLSAVVAIYAAHTNDSARRSALAARRFGQYRLTEKIGGGGMGEVYKAEHRLMKRPCALKLIRPAYRDDGQFLTRFEREVQATAQLTHWNTIQIYDFGQSADGAFFYVMELLQGANLGDVVGRFGPLPPARAIHLLRQTCGALSEAHTSGLVHRDIKPENIFAARIGGLYDVAKLLDFGAVRETTPQDGTQLTACGTIIGTARYMSPEQAAASPDVGPAADLYSLGAVAYFLLTGCPPFPQGNPAEVIIAQIHDAPLPPARLAPDLPADLEQVVLRCLAKEPSARYPSALDLEQALAGCRCAGQWTQEQAADWWRWRLLPSD